MQFPVKSQKALYFLTYVAVYKMDYQDKWITAHKIEVMWASTWTPAIKNMFFLPTFKCTTKQTYLHNVADDIEHENTHKQLPSISFPCGCSEYKALGILGEVLFY